MTDSLAALDAASAFENMGDIAYLVSAEGRIADYTARNWDRFAKSNDGAELTCRDNVVGRPLLDFVTGEETRDSYRAFHELLMSGRDERVAFFYSCDGPEVHRAMRMVMASVGPAAEPAGILYHSTVLRETMRPPVKFLDRQLVAREEESWRLVSICSYCKGVRWNGPERWIAPDAYYREGGPDNVRLSHGICPACFESIVEPALKALESD